MSKIQVLEKSSATPDLRKNIKPIQNVLQCCGATAQTQNLYIDDGLCGPKPIAVSDYSKHRYWEFVFVGNRGINGYLKEIHEFSDRRGNRE